MAIIRQRLLRVGAVQYSGTSGSSRDEYLVVTDARHTKEALIGLFLVYGSNPVPKQTFKTLGAQILMADAIEAEALGSKLWKVTVPYKELNREQPDDSPQFPIKANNTTADDWSPGYSVRSEVIFEDAAKAYYVSGFPAGQAATKFGADAAVPQMSVMANSAFQPFVNTPQKRRRIRIYTVRWVESSVPAGLLAAEGKINDSAYETTTLGYTHTWATHTALINSINWAPQRWQDQDLVGIEAEIIYDPETWLWVTIDQGLNARAGEGDPDGRGVTISGGDLKVGQPRLRALKDLNGKAVSEPVFLDGDGQPLADPDGDDPIEITWRGFEEVDFSTVALVEDL